MLRFGNDHRRTVRRYTVQQATDELVTSYSTGGLLSPRQKLCASGVQRTDTMAEPFTACSPNLEVNKLAPNLARAICYVNWEGFPKSGPTAGW